jgi:squalene-associated FAD-dependent desaturase
MSLVHIVGAGMAGLACAIRCVRNGHEVALYEATPRAGGRARSYEDEGIGCLIDNGSHMLMGANQATQNYLENIGSRHLVTEIAPAAFPFMEPATGKQWTVRPGSAWFPLWLLHPGRRVPGSSFGDIVKMLRLVRADREQTVADYVGHDTPLMETFWQPICRAVLNTDATEASARLLGKVISMSFFKGEAACRPIIFGQGLSAALVNPAIRLIEEKGGTVRFQARVRGLRWEGDTVIAIRFQEGLLRVGTNDAVVLAVPPDACVELWPDAKPPMQANPIINVHFRLEEPISLPGGYPFLGLIGTDAQWLFMRDNILSVTISAAESFVDRSNLEIANHLWDEITKILNRNMGRLPPWRVIKERRATIAQTPAIARQRTRAVTKLDNLFIAGDWTNTGLPATIDGAITSGNRAARLAITRLTKNPEKT